MSGCATWAAMLSIVCPSVILHTTGMGGRRSTAMSGCAPGRKASGWAGIQVATSPSSDMARSVLLEGWASVRPVVTCAIARRIYRVSGCV